MSTTTSLENGFAGIAVIGATRVVVRGNTLMNIGSANSGGDGVLGIGVSQPTIVSVVENELRGIGSLSITTAQTYGIRVVGPFDDVRVVGNRVEAALPTSTTGSALAYSGVSVTNPLRIYYPGLSGAELDVSQIPAAAIPAAPTPTPTPAPAPTPRPAPVITVAQPAVQPLLFQLNSSTSTSAAASAVLARKALVSYVGDLSLTTAPDPIVIATANQQSADVSGNTVDVVPSLSALIDADIVGSCLLRANRAPLATASSSATPTKPTGTTTPSPTVVAYATVLIASDNFVNAYAGVTGLSLIGTAQATILGNISTSGITTLGGRPIGAPWDTLNGG
jgi:hypothetical protein